MGRKNMLVIGASGFLGRNLIQELSADKYSIVATYFTTPNIDVKKAMPYRLDLSNREQIKALLNIRHFDYIFYFSSTTNVSRAIERPILDNLNLIQFLTLIEELKQSYELSKTKLVYASSGGMVYGNNDRLPIPEGACLSPLSPYGITKAAAEQYLKYYHANHGLNYVALRYANPYGRYQNPFSGTGAPNIFLYKVLRQAPIFIYGDPKEIYRDYIYVTDAIDITLKIVESSNKQNVYNIGCGQSFSLHDIIHLSEKIAGRTANVMIREAEKGLVKRVVLDIGQIMDEYSWTPKISILDGMRENYRWIQQWMSEQQRD